MLHGQDLTQKANTVAVIDFILSHALRLFHPFMPFITEELWHGMGYHQDMPADQGGTTIMFAPWPKALGEDFLLHYGLTGSILATVDAKYELVSQGRNLRREANIPAGKKVSFVLKPTGEVSAHDHEVIRLLLNAESLTIDLNYQAKKGTATLHSQLGDLYLPLDGLVDVAAERTRLAKELEKVASEITKVEQKLGNPQFVERVPASVLQEHQQRLVEWQTKHGRLKAALEDLEGK